MRLIGNSTKFCLILGGGERLQGQAARLRSLSAIQTRLPSTFEKPGRCQRAVGLLSRSVIC